MFNLELYLRYTETRTEVLKKVVTCLGKKISFQSQETYDERTTKCLQKITGILENVLKDPKLLESIPSNKEELAEIYSHFKQSNLTVKKEMDGSETCTLLTNLGESLDEYDLQRISEIIQSDTVLPIFKKYVDAEVSQQVPPKDVIKPFNRALWLLDRRGKIEHDLKSIMRHVLDLEECNMLSWLASNKDHFSTLNSPLEPFVLNVVLPQAVKLLREIRSTPESIRESSSEAPLPVEEASKSSKSNSKQCVFEIKPVKVNPASSTVQSSSQELPTVTTPLLSPPRDSLRNRTSHVFQSLRNSISFLFSGFTSQK